VSQEQSEQSVVVVPLAGKCDFVGKRYTIRTLKDLYKIPSNKLEHCLIDIWASIESHKATAKLSGVDALPLDEIEWVDDGKHDLAVKIQSA
jgi:hypothetical protein